MTTIRGSFTVRWDPFGSDGRGGYRVSIPNYEGGEVIPVPDEAAIERAAQALGRKLHWLQDDERARQLAEVVLRAALEPRDA